MWLEFCSTPEALAAVGWPGASASEIQQCFSIVQRHCRPVHQCGSASIAQIRAVHCTMFGAMCSDYVWVVGRKNGALHIPNALLQNAEGSHCWLHDDVDGVLHLVASQLMVFCSELAQDEACTSCCSPHGLKKGAICNMLSVAWLTWLVRQASESPSKSVNIGTRQCVLADDCIQEGRCK